MDDKINERKNAFRLTDHLNEAMSGHSTPLPPRSVSSTSNVFDTLRSAVSPSSSVRGQQHLSQLDGSGFSTPVRPPSSMVSTRRAFYPESDSKTSVIGRPTSSAARDNHPFGIHVVDTSMRKIRSLHPAHFMPPPPDEEGGSDTVVGVASVRSATPVDTSACDGSGNGVGRDIKEREFSLSHLLTNILILQVGYFFSNEFCDIINH